MKGNRIFLVGTLALAFSLPASASSIAKLATVMINNDVTITLPATTSQQCIKELATVLGVKASGLVYPVPAGTTLKFSKCDAISLTIQGNYGGNSCDNSQAEIYLEPGKSTYDVSLVNGYSGSVEIDGKQSIIADSAKANNANNPVDGVYPYGCSLCKSRTSNDCGNSNPKKHTCSTIKNCQITDDTSAFTVSFGGD